MDGHLGGALGKCFLALSMQGSEENSHVMKALTRVISLTQESTLPYMQQLVQEFTAKLKAVAKVRKLDWLQMFSMIVVRVNFSLF